MQQVVDHLSLSLSFSRYYCYINTQQALQASAESEEVSSLDRRGLRAYHKEFRQVVEMADVVLEVLDARDPLGTRCAEVEESVMAAGSDKKLILVLNKIG